MALAKVLMKNLRNVLQFNKTLIIFTIFIFIYCFINSKINYKSKYNGNETSITGIITNIKIKSDYLELELKAKEKILAYYKYESITDINIGDKVTLTGKLNKVTSTNIPNTFNYQRYLKYKKIYYTFNIDKITTISSNNIFYKLKNIIFKRILKLNNKDYYLTFILGNKSLLDNENYNNFLDNGISHLLAISGMHISILLLLCKKNKPTSIILLILFLFLTGFSSSVYRVVIFYILKLFNKKKSNIYLLILTMDILLLIDPFRIFDLGFIYSFITTFGIFYYKDHIKNIIHLSFITFLFSLPVTALINYEINLFSIINNLIFVPLISYVVYPLCLISFLFSFLNSLFSVVINILNYLNELCNHLAIFITIPKFNLLLLLIYYFILLKKNNKLLLIPVLLINILLPKLDNNYYVYYLDIGQGDCAALISPHRKDVILIDTGGKVNSSYNVSDNTIKFLKSKGITKIDYLILTHGDYDHAGEAINIINKIKVKHVIFNSDLYKNIENNIIKVLKTKSIDYTKENKAVLFGKTTLSFLHHTLYEDENNNSIINYLNIYNHQFLFMGDASIDREKELINKYNLTNIEFLKIGHHGSKTSSSEYFVKKVKPKYSVISVGLNNKYNHPSKETINNLSDSTIYRTDYDGTIEVKINKKKLKITNYPS